MDARAVRQLSNVVRQRRVERGEVMGHRAAADRELPPATKMPPPSAKRPFGAEAVERLPATTLFSSVSCPGSSSRMPPPTASLLSAPPTRLSATLVFFSVSTPQLSMPPPPASANRQGPVGQIERALGTVSAGSTRLPAMTLSTDRDGRAGGVVGGRWDLDAAAERGRPLEVGRRRSVRSARWSA